jgi:anthranilate phosphoribosyltransferase
MTFGMLRDMTPSLLARIARGQGLTCEQAGTLFEELMTGRMRGDDAESLLLALADRGETVDELVGAARVMRRHLVPIACDAPNAIDTCGTGGDGVSTFNVSTAAAFIAAGAGAVVAKHGNKTNSRRSGSAEALAALGVNIDAPPTVVERCLRDIGIGFLFAPRLHPAMARVADLRRKLGRPTIFNLLGPLTNPAGVRRQVIGVPRDDLTVKLATALIRLGAERAFVVHGNDGLCDLSSTGPSRVLEVNAGRVSESEITPEDAGLPCGSLSELTIDSPAQSAKAIGEILDGQPGARRNHALLNAAVALVAAGIADDLKDGVLRAAASIDTGAARAKLDRLVELSGAAK